MCAGCGDARYCGAACQRAHWKEHRVACKQKQSSVDRHDADFAAFVDLYESARKPLGAEDGHIFHVKAAHDVLRELTSAARPSVSSQKVMRILDTLRGRMIRGTFHADVITAVVRGGGAAMVVAIMAASKSCGLAMIVCCGLLTQLALPYCGAADPACRKVDCECTETIAAAGGAAAVVRAMSDHSACGVVATSGCYALSRISYVSAGAAASVIAAGGLLAVMAALRAHWASVQAPVASTAVQALHYILVSVKHVGDSVAGDVRAIIDDGCLPVLLAVLRSRRGNAFIQSDLPLCLNLIAESSPENRASVVAAGGGEYITSLAACRGSRARAARGHRGSRRGLSPRQKCSRRSHAHLRVPPRAFYRTYLWRCGARV